MIDSFDALLCRLLFRFHRSLQRSQQTLVVVRTIDVVLELVDRHSHVAHERRHFVYGAQTEIDANAFCDFNK